MTSPGALGNVRIRRSRGGNAAAHRPEPSDRSARARPPANGLTAVLQPHDAAEVAAVQLWVRAGARDERPDEAGLSHFIEHLLFKGTPSRGPGVIDETISGPRGRDERGDLPGLDVLPRRPAGRAPRHGAGHPRRRRPARRVRPGRGRARATRGARGDPARRGHAERGPLARPGPRATSASTRTGGPSSAPPSPSPACRSETIVDYYRRSYVPNNATVVVAGSMPAAESLDAVRAAFGGWAPRPLPARPRRTPAPPARLAGSRSRRRSTRRTSGWPGRAPSRPTPTSTRSTS